MTHLETTDYMYTNNVHGLSLLKFKSQVCMTVFENIEYQIFYTDAVNAVYEKKTEKVYNLTIDKWTRMVLKLETTINHFHD